MKANEVKINKEVVPCENIISIQLVCVGDQLFREITCFICGKIIFPLLARIIIWCKLQCHSAIFKVVLIWALCSVLHLHFAAQLYIIPNSPFHMLKPFSYILIIRFET